MWRRFFIIFSYTAIASLALLYALVLIIDPYDTLPFSPRLERTAVSTNQRFSYPALAAKARFDSAVIGTSTTRLLKPGELDAALGGRFVNLSMNSATAYEQSQIFKIFLAAHPRPKTIIFGIDISWCEAGAMPARFTFRPFPPWLYDGDPWNDAFYLLNMSAVEQAGRQLATLTGLRETKYGRDGYRNFLPMTSEYDLTKARNNLYGGAVPQPKTEVAPPGEGYSEYRRGLVFPTHDYLVRMIETLPAETLKVFMFVPYHHFTQPARGSADEARWDECKQRTVRLASRHANAHVLDFMFLSQITGVDTHYWDPLHYTTEIAARLAPMISSGVMDRRGQPGLFRYLGDNSP